MSTATNPSHESREAYQCWVGIHERLADKLEVGAAASGRCEIEQATPSGSMLTWVFVALQQCSAVQWRAPMPSSILALAVK